MCHRTSLRLPSAARTVSAHMLLTAIGLGMVAVGCAPTPPAMQIPPTLVSAAKPIEREVVDASYFTGRTDGSEFVEIRARVSGYLTKVHFKAGSVVEAGDPLFEIDERPYRVALDQAQGELERVNAALKRAKLDLDRNTPLAAKNVVSREEFDRIVSDHAQAEATVRTAEAAVERAKLDLSWTKIEAPITGLVSRELITVGNLVAADTTKLTTIVRQDPMYVYYDIDEKTVLTILRLIREGKFKSAREHQVPIAMGLGNDESYPYAGFVNFVDNRLDPNSGTMRIRGTFDNPIDKNGAVKFVAGMFARIRLDLGPPYPAVMVTERAILADQGQKFLYVVNEKNEVERRDVRIGRLENGLRVIESGLTKDDRVVVNGVQRVRPGATVKVQEVEQPERK